MNEIDRAIDALVAVKPYADELEVTKGKVESARKDLASITTQLEKLREQVKSERNARALEAHEEKKKHDESVVARQAEAEFVHSDIDHAREELRMVQNEVAKWHKKAEELAAKTTKLERSLA